MPLLSSAIFAESNGHWKIEAHNLFVMYEGEYGEPPKVEIIRIGNNKFAARLEYEHRHDLRLETKIALLIPYQEHVGIAYEQVIYFDNFNDCGSVQQCAAFKAEIDFDKSTNVLTIIFTTFLYTITFILMAKKGLNLSCPRSCRPINAASNLNNSILSATLKGFNFGCHIAIVTNNPPARHQPL